MLQLSMATMYSDRTAALHDGRVRIEGCDVHHVMLRPGEIFHRIFKFEEFDIAEMSLSTHVMTTVRGDLKYIGIPAFPLRMFRHSGIYIRTDRGIDSPQALRGKTIGLPEFQQTANVWIRGILQDEYGVDMASARWRTGGLEEGGREERSDIRLSKDIDWQVIPRDRTLSDMLEQGELDAVISPRPPPCFSRKDKCRNVDQLFPDHPLVERDYYQRTRIFPIMHVVGIRRSIAKQNPWLPVSVFKAFIEAKDLIDLRNGSVLPWAQAEYRRTQSILGEDYWSYHLAANRHVIEAFCRHAFDQGLVERIPAPEELFAPSSLNLARA